MPRFIEVSWCDYCTWLLCLFHYYCQNLWTLPIGENHCTANLHKCMHLNCANTDFWYAGDSATSSPLTSVRENHNRISVILVLTVFSCFNPLVTSRLVTCDISWWKLWWVSMKGSIILKAASRWLRTVSSYSSCCSCAVISWYFCKNTSLPFCP